MDSHLAKPQVRRRAERGVATLEFAIILPIFVAFLVGIVEFGHLWYLRHALTNASREGARYGAVFKNRGELGNLGNLAKSYLDPDFVEAYGVEANVESPITDTGQPLTVTLTATKNASLLIGPLLERMGFAGFGDKLNSINGQTTMIFE